MRVDPKKLQPFPSIPERTFGWEARLGPVLTHHRDTPFSWGTADCLVLVADVCLALTGVDFMVDVRGYTTEEEAMELMAARGLDGVGAVLEDVFGEPIPTATARIGDVGLITRKGVDGSVVVTGASVMGKHLRGSFVVSALDLRKAYRVG